MKRCIALSLVLGTLITACGGGAPPDPPDPGAAPEHSVDCSGAVHAQSVGVDLHHLETRGARGPVSKDGGEGAASACAAQDAALRYELPAGMCLRRDVVAWNGSACIAHTTITDAGSLRCTGRDCPGLYSGTHGREACEAAHLGCAAK